MTSKKGLSRLVGKVSEEELVELAKEGFLCQTCLTGDRDWELLLCDTCNKGFFFFFFFFFLYIFVLVFLFWFFCFGFFFSFFFFFLFSFFLFYFLFFIFVFCFVLFSPSIFVWDLITYQRRRIIIYYDNYKKKKCNIIN